jgi:pimeloyl-ACP methyl ester carboxylesterase
MKTIELSAGTIEYEDTGGTGPTVVFLHGLLGSDQGAGHRQVRGAVRRRGFPAGRASENPVPG